MERIGRGFVTSNTTKLTTTLFTCCNFSNDYIVWTTKRSLNFKSCNVFTFSLSFYKGQQSNPFAVPPSFHFWAPWIGRNTRCSNKILNTEFLKISPSKHAEVREITISEDHLTNELFKQKVKMSVRLFLVVMCKCPNLTCKLEALHRF